MIANLKRAACWINFYAKISRSIASLLHPQSGMGNVSTVSPTHAPVAQLDRASDFGSEGCRFKSCPVHHGFYWGFATLSTAGPTGTDRSELGPYLGYLLGAIGNAFRLQPPMVHPL